MFLVSLVQKFSVVIFCSLLLLSFVGISSFIKARDAQESVASVIDVVIPAKESLGELKASFKEFRIAAIKYPTAKPADLAKLKETFSNYKSMMEKQITALGGIVDGSKLDGLKKTITDYDKVVGSILTDSVNEGNIDKGTGIIRDYMVPLGNTFDKLIDDVQKELDGVSREKSDELVSDVSPVSNVVIIIIVIFLNFIFFRALAKSITSRIRILGEASEKIAAGNLKDPIPQIGHDELGHLGADMNKLIDNLHSIIVTMKNDSEVLQTSSSNMTASSQEIQYKSNMVLDKLITTSSAAEEMVATSQEISSNCSLAANASEETKGLVVNGMDVVTNTVNDIRAHSEKTKEDAQLILALGEKTQEINSIIATIEDIASQTNLLSLNASQQKKYPLRLTPLRMMLRKLTTLLLILYQRWMKSQLMPVIYRQLLMLLLRRLAMLTCRSLRSQLQPSSRPVHQRKCLPICLQLKTSPRKWQMHQQLQKISPMTLMLFLQEWTKQLTSL